MPKKMIRNKKTWALFTMCLVCSAISLAQQTSSNWYDTTHLLTLEYQDEALHFIDIIKTTKQTQIKQHTGNYEVQLVSVTNTILFNNQFRFNLQFIPEPGPDCFSGEIECDLAPIQVDEDTETIAIPSLPNERYIRILKDNEIKLEIDLLNPPYEYQEEFDYDKIIQTTKSWINNRATYEEVIQSFD
tara:strand:- start:10 stop:570 length:561 start_codon:yes stop_codon:yes gene_type:complete